jgi:hypothetical protein
MPRKIFAVGTALPPSDIVVVPFDSDKSLLDADIILFQPTLGNALTMDTYGKRPVLMLGASDPLRGYLLHWQRELRSAVEAGHLLIVFLARPEEVVTSEAFSELISSHSAVPWLEPDGVVVSTGAEMKIARGASLISTYWAELASHSKCEVYLNGKFTQVLIETSRGARTLGAMIRNPSGGSVLFLPPLRYDERKFLRENQKGHPIWTPEAKKFSGRLIAALVSIADHLKSEGAVTPPPSWAQDQTFRLIQEQAITQKIIDADEKIASLQQAKLQLEVEQVQAGSLRRLLYEQGHPLESAVLEALALFGFEAATIAEGDSEFDAVFTSPEGRFLGEVEGKDSRPINIEKFSQLARNIDEDFERHSVDVHAKGVLFGNAYRLRPLAEREDFFTAKCIASAKRIEAALVRTPDLFNPARYLKEHPDEDYAHRCREAILMAKGEVVSFPLSPTND